MPSSQSPTPVQFVGTTTPPQGVAVDLLFIPLFQRDDPLDDLPEIRDVTGGELERALASGEFRAKPYQSFVTPAVGGRWKAQRVAFVGAGPRAEATPERVRKIAASASYLARQRAASTIALVTRGLSATVVAGGLSGAEFESGVYKSDRNDHCPFPARVEVVAPGEDAAGLAEAVRVGRVVAECANFTRSLSNEPGNVLTPREFAAR